jgi:ankyrin repeat protein
MTTTNEQKLLESVLKRDRAEAQRLIALNPDLDRHGETAIHDPSLVKRSKPNARGTFTIDDGNFNMPAYRVEGKTALYIATANDDAEMVRLLLEAGANPNVPISGGLHPLSIAADTGSRDEICTLLLKHGADPNVRSPYGNSTPLMKRASIGNQFRLVSLMLEKGGDAALRDDQGRTALDYAKMRGGYRAAFREAPLRMIFFAAMDPKGLFIEAPRDVIETRRTIRLLEKSMKP